MQKQTDSDGEIVALTSQSLGSQAGNEKDQALIAHLKELVKSQEAELGKLQERITILEDENAKLQELRRVCDSLETHSRNLKSTLTEVR